MFQMRPTGGVFFLNRTGTIPMNTDARLQNGLLLLRLSTGVFFLVWGIEKLVEPEKAANVFRVFYFSDPPTDLVIVLGVLQTAIILAFMAGFQKRLTTGLLFAMHLVSTLSSWERIITPYDIPNILFWAAIPIVFALWLLYTCRDLDSKLSWDHR